MIIEPHRSTKFSAKLSDLTGRGPTESFSYSWVFDAVSHDAKTQQVTKTFTKVGRARRAVQGAVGVGGGGRRSGRRGTGPHGTWRWRACVVARPRLGLLQGECLGGPRRWRRGGPVNGGVPGSRPPLEVRVGCQQAHAGRPLAGDASLVSGVACIHRQGPGSARRGGASWRGDPGPVAVGAGGEGRRQVGQAVESERGAVRAGTRYVPHPSLPAASLYHSR